MSGIGSTNRFGGLASGMDTSSIVESMLANTQAKIDKQNSLKQQNVWRQHIYREMIGSISSFRNKYFSFSSPTTNLMSHSLFNTMAAIASSDAIKVTGSANASSGKMTIEKVTQLATNTKQQSSVDVTGEISGNVDISKFERKVTINVGGTSADITVKGKTSSEIIKNLDTDLKATFGKNIEAKMDGGKLVIKDTTANNTTKIKIEGGTLLGTQTLGVSIGQEGTGKIESTIDPSKSTVNLTVSLDGTEKDVSIDVTSITTEQDLVKEINTRLGNTFGSSVEAQLVGKDVVFKTLKTDGTPDDSRRLVIDGDKAVLDALGLKGGSSNKISFNTKLSDANFKTQVQGNTYEFSINGITIEGSTDETIGDLVNKINGSGAGVRITYSSFSDKFSIETSAYGAGAGIDISQKEGNVLSAIFGVTSGSKAGSNDFYMSEVKGGTIDVSKFKNGGEFALKINGKDVKINIESNEDANGKKIDHTGESLVDALNKELGKAKVDIKFSYDKTSKSITMQNPQRDNVEFINNDLAQGMGFKNGTKTSAVGTTTLSSLGLDKGSIDVGTTTIDLSTISTLDDLVTSLNSALKSNGGSARLDSTTGRIEIDGGNAPISIKATANSADGSTAMEAIFGSTNIDLSKTVQNASNSLIGSSVVVNGTAVTNTTTLTDAGLNTGTINFMGTNIDLSTIKTASGTGSATMDDLVTELNRIAKIADPQGSVVLTKNGEIQITGVNGNIKGIGTDGETAMSKLFGSSTVNVSSNGLNLIQAGQNATFEMNGQVYERNSNVIEIDGITIELVNLSNTAIDITTSRDTSKVVDAVKGFVEDYNKLIEGLNKVISEEPSYKKYPPLTDAQRKDMSESEIKLWEEKAKEGLVRNDSAVSSILGQMRSTLYAKPDGAKFALFDLGITTGNWKDNGKLVMEDPPTKLLQALENDPQEVQKLFADATNGLAIKMKDILENATKSRSPNSLVDIAGNVGSANDNSALGREIENYEKNLMNLKRKYELEEDRYWRQFTAMEKAISTMNQQSAFLSQQMM